MADKLIIGGPPPANVTEFPPGSVFYQVEQLGADASGRTFRLTTWAQTGLNMVDWGDNIYYDKNDFVAPPPVYPALGKTFVEHTYTGRPGTLYYVYFEQGGVRQRFQVTAGLPAVVDDVSSDGITRPPAETQGDVFAERSKLAVSVRKQMGAMAKIRKGGRVN